MTIEYKTLNTVRAGIGWHLSGFYIQMDAERGFWWWFGQRRQGGVTWRFEERRMREVSVYEKGRGADGRVTQRNAHSSHNARARTHTHAPHDWQAWTNQCSCFTGTRARRPQYRIWWSNRGDWPIQFHWVWDKSRLSQSRRDFLLSLAVSIMGRAHVR